nr:alpha/beta hydrolase [Rhodococcus sp. 06-1059B-a]
MSSNFEALPDAPAVTTLPVTITSVDGTVIESRWYLPESAGDGSAVIYVHGGGMICGSVAIYDRFLRYYVQLTGVPFLAVDYRLAPEYPGSSATADCLAVLEWLHANAEEQGVDASRIAIMGDSAGGGVAAGTAILARDRGIALAQQILIYPMLDDRNTTPDPALAPIATWTYENNLTGWTALLGEDVGGPAISPVVAPGRLTAFEGLAPAYIEVGELDIFRDESVLYASGLMRAGVSCELQVHPHAPHGYDLISIHAALSRRALDSRVRLVTSL